MTRPISPDNKPREIIVRDEARCSRPWGYQRGYQGPARPRIPPMRLTDTAVRKAKPTDKTQRLFDGGGLYLEITPAGGKRWRQKYRFAGKEKLLAHGTYPDVSLAEARERRDKARKLLANGVDPGQHRQAEKAAGAERARTQFEAWAAQLSGPVADANYRYARDLEELNELAAKGAIGSDELTRAQENLRKEHERNVEAIQERLEPGRQLLKDLQFELDLMKLTNAERATAIQLRGLDTEQVQKYGDAIAETNRKIMENAEQADFMDSWRGEFQDFFSDVLTGTKSIGDAFEDMLSNISAMIAERIAQNWVDQLFGQMGTTNGGAAGGGDGGWLSGLASIFSSFGGSRAGGGDVLANRGYWVGEQGPEWFQPRTAGTVLPHEESMRRTGGGRSGGGNVFNINVPVEGRVERYDRVQVATEMQRTLAQAGRVS